MSRDKKISNLFHLRDFRKQSGLSPEIEMDSKVVTARANHPVGKRSERLKDSSHYRPAPEEVVDNVRAALRYLPEFKSRLGDVQILSRTKNIEKAIVTRRKGERSVIFEANQSLDQLESLVVPLENASNEHDRKLAKVMPAYYLGSIVMHDIIKRDNLIHPKVQRIPLRKVRGKEMGTGDDYEDCKQLTSWRAAGGLAMVGFSAEVRGDIYSYLGDILDSRFLHAKKVISALEDAGREPPKDVFDLDIVTQGLLNPLNHHSLKATVEGFICPTTFQRLQSETGQQ